MKSIISLSISAAFLFSLASCQDSTLNINVYSDTACQTFIATYNCADYYYSCTQFPNGQGVNSYQIPTKGENCDPPTGGVFDDWSLGTGGCGGDNLIGGGCGLDLDCIPTDDATAYYFRCSEDFTESKARRLGKSV